MKRAYIPRPGDIVWLDFSPHVGHEQGGRRPALVLSPKAYNGPTGLAICCPITSQSKQYPFEVALPPGLKASGAVLADHVENIDWRGRNAKYICTAPQHLVEDVLAKIAVLLDAAAH